MRRAILTRQAEKAVNRRVFALQLSCSGLLILLALALAGGLLSPRVAGVGIVTVILAHGAGVLLITRRTIRTFGPSAWVSEMPMDVDTRRRLVVRIRWFKVAIVALVLCLILRLAQGGPALPLLVAVAISL